MKVCTTCSAEYGDDQLFCQRDGTPLRNSGASTDLVNQVIADRYAMELQPTAFTGSHMNQTEVGRATANVADQNRLAG